MVVQTSIPLPNDRRLLKRFSKAVDPLLSRRHIALVSCGTLQATRDTLLPKLISGDLRIADAKRLIKAAG